MLLKMEHVLILAVAVFMLYHFTSRCRCTNRLVNGFSVGIESEDSTPTPTSWDKTDCRVLAPNGNCGDIKGKYNCAKYYNSDNNKCGKTWAPFYDCAPNIEDPVTSKCENLLVPWGFSDNCPDWPELDDYPEFDKDLKGNIRQSNLWNLWTQQCPEQWIKSDINTNKSEEPWAGKDCPEWPELDDYPEFNKGLIDGLRKSLLWDKWIKYCPDTCRRVYDSQDPRPGRHPGDSDGWNCGEPLASKHEVCVNYGDERLCKERRNCPHCMDGLSCNYDVKVRDGQEKNYIYGSCDGDLI